jgi:hypothetical protein
MLEFKTENKSGFRVILGIVFLVISMAWISNKMSENQIISLFDWSFTAIFALNGLVHIIQGLGFTFTKGLGK